MHKTLLIPLTFAAASLPVLAMGAGPAADANGDGMLSVEELQAAFPEVTVESFMAMDTDTDGLLNTDEVAAAQDAGILPASDG